MKVLAKAYPNPRYMHYNNVKRVVLEARLTGNRVHFYEVDTENGKSKFRDEQFIKELINGKGESINRRPFLHNSKVNADFYAVLMRNRKRYRDTFLQLKPKGEVPRFRRTKFNKS